MASSVGAGRLRSRIEVLVNNPSTSPVGQSVASWTSLGTFWAEVITSSGDETMNADQLKAIVGTKITMRQSIPITPGKNQIVYNGRTLSIISVVKLDNFNMFYEIMCKELVK